MDDLLNLLEKARVLTSELYVKGGCKGLPSVKIEWGLQRGWEAETSWDGHSYCCAYPDTTAHAVISTLVAELQKQLDRLPRKGSSDGRID